MWPERVDALEQTATAEARIEDAYRKAIRDWAPYAVSAVVPTLAGQFNGDPYQVEQTIPPNPEAISSTQQQWNAALAVLVLPEVAAVWDEAVTEAAAALGLELDDPVAELGQARDDYLDSYRQIAALVPASVGADLSALLTQRREELLTASITADLRNQARAALAAGSELLSKAARRLGFHGGSVLNHAHLTAAKHRGIASRKQWISMHDDRVRETHRAADGQIVAMDGKFQVGKSELSFPGDPAGPPGEVINCRCRIGIVHALTASGEENTMTQTDAPETFRTFTDAVVAFTGVPTSDRRKFLSDAAITYRTPPRPLMWMRDSGDGSGHTNAVSVGVIEQMRQEDDKILASGYMLNTPDAEEAISQLEHGITRPSVDLGEMDWFTCDETDQEINEEAWFDLDPKAKVFTAFSAAEIIAVTLVSKPAFGDTQLTLDPEPVVRDAALVAAAVAEFTPRNYPAAFFTDPQLTGPTPVTLEDGRVFGHIALWDTPHRKFFVAGETQLAPRSPSGYEHFHTSPPVTLDDGTKLAVGHLTVGTGHAGEGLGAMPAQAHYDDTGACWALVRAGEDAHGIWFSGVPAPWATPEQIEAGLASPLSGDWRNFGQGLDLIAALSVNTPGFRIRGHNDTYGRPATLVAALSPTQRNEKPMTRDEIKDALKDAFKEQIAQQEFDGSVKRALEAAAELTQPMSPADEVDRILARAEL